MCDILPTYKRGKSYECDVIYLEGEIFAETEIHIVLFVVDEIRI